MAKIIRIVHFINQFFGQYGGEEMAGMPPVCKEGAMGPGKGLEESFDGDAKVLATIVCGDNYFNEHLEEAQAFVLEAVGRYQPDLFVAGPAFTAGRYGVACGTACDIVHKEFGIPAVTGMFGENPAVEMFRSNLYILRTSDNARSMREEMAKIARLARKLLSGKEIGTPEEEGYFFRGLVRPKLCEDQGAKRSIDMLLNKCAGRPFQTETPMMKFDVVERAPAIQDLSKAMIALVTDGGLYPAGNPDKMPFINSDRCAFYSIEGLDHLEGENYCILHRGYDGTCVQARPDRLVPVDGMRDLEKEGYIGKLYPYFITTTGLNASIKNSKQTAKQMIRRFKEDGVNAVLLTST